MAATAILQLEQVDESGSSPSGMRKYRVTGTDSSTEARQTVLAASPGTLDLYGDGSAIITRDGVRIEPESDLAWIAGRHPDKILLGNMDSRILASGNKDAIYAEVERCTQFGRDCPGYFYSVSNHIPYTVPIDAVRHYFEACEKLGRR